MGEFACLELRHACSATLNVKRSQGPDPFLRVAARVFVRSLPAAFDAVFELTGNELVGSGPDSIVQTVVLGAIETRVGEVECVRRGGSQTDIAVAQRSRAQCSTGSRQAVGWPSWRLVPPPNDCTPKSDVSCSSGLPVFFRAHFDE